MYRQNTKCKQSRIKYWLVYLFRKRRRGRFYNSSSFGLRHIWQHSIIIQKNFHSTYARLSQLWNGPRIHKNFEYYYAIFRFIDRENRESVYWFLFTVKDYVHRRLMQCRRNKVRPFFSPIPLKVNKQEGWGWNWHRGWGCSASELHNHVSRICTLITAHSGNPPREQHYTHSLFYRYTYACICICIRIQ